MHPTKLILTNWCQHESLEVPFVIGTNAIRGRNGSGKSNILAALCMCLAQTTHNTDKKSDKKTDNITDGRTSGTIRYEFEHEQDAGFIEVKLSRNYTETWAVTSAKIAAATESSKLNAEDPSHPLTDEERKLLALKPNEKVAFKLHWREDKLRTAGEVSKWLASHVGIDCKTTKANFFPAQGDVDGALSDDPEQRQRVFHEKAGTTMCAQIYKALGDELSQASDVNTTTDELDRAKADQAVAEQRQTEALRNRNALEDLELDPEEHRVTMRTYEQNVQNQTRRTALTEEAQRAEQLVAQWQEQLNAITPVVAELRNYVQSEAQAQDQRKVLQHTLATAKANAQQREVLRNQAKTLVEQIQNLKAEMDQYATRKQELTSAHAELQKFDPQQDATYIAWAAQERLNQEQRQQIQQSIQNIEQQLASLGPEPQEPISEADFQVKVEFLAQIKTRHTQLQEWLETFHTGKCPTCGAAVETSTVESYQSEISTLDINTASAGLELDRQARENHRVALNTYRTAKTQADTNLMTLQTNLANLGEATPIDELAESQAKERQARRASIGQEIATVDNQITIAENKLTSAQSTFESNQQQLKNLPQDVPDESISMEEINQQIAEYNNTVSTLQLKEQELSNCQGQLTHFQTQRDTQYELLKQLDESMGGNVTLEEYQNASNQVSKIMLNTQAIQDADVELRTAEQLLEQAIKRHDEAAVAAARVGPLLAWLEMVRDVRECFHKKSWPAEIVAWYANKLAQSMQKYLEQFDADFSLVINDNQEIIGQFPDKVMPGSRFSGGEKNMANIAMRMATTDLYPTDLNILVLDEIEVHLDKETVDKLPIILEEVQSIARKRGLVVIFISHHPALEGLADNEIYVGY